MCNFFTAVRASSMGTPHSECLGVSFQAFGIGQRNSRRCDLAYSFARHLLAGNDADEVEHTEAAAHTRHSTGGQHVVRSGDVVARGLRCKLVEENRARVLHQWHQLGREREMLGRNAIRYLNGLFQRGDQKNGAAARERLRRDRVGARALLRILLNFFRQRA